MLFINVLYTKFFIVEKPIYKEITNRNASEYIFRICLYIYMNIYSPSGSQEIIM